MGEGLCAADAHGHAHHEEPVRHARRGAEFDFFVEWANLNLRFTDRNPSYDESPGADGIVTYSLGWPNKFQICETSPPPKTILTSTACQTIDAKWGQTYTFTLHHEAQIF